MQQKAEAYGLAFDKKYIAQSIRPDPLGELRDSKVGFYKLIPNFLIDYSRPVGGGQDANEAVHWTAVARMEQAQKPEYKPANLMAYLDRGGKVVEPEPQEAPVR